MSRLLEMTSVSGARILVRPGRRPLQGGCAWRLFLALGLWCSHLGVAADPYISEYENSPPDYFQRAKKNAAEQQELHRRRVAIPKAVEPILPVPESPEEIRARAASLAAKTQARRQNLFCAALLFLVGMQAIRTFRPGLIAYFNPAFNPWLLAPDAVARFASNIRAEDAAFGKFITAIQNGPLPVAGNSVFSIAGQNPLDECCGKIRELIGTSQKLLREINRASKPSARLQLLADLRREIHGLKGETGRPELLPAWQTATALEGLLGQLTDRADNVSQSTLHTVAASVALLEDLTKPGVRADLLSTPPLRLLAVDDDMISRKAVTLALKKALNQPDLADNGETALALATMHTYDVIFLDVQMPGMDGFELCTKIHETIPNAATPVVFVTCVSDFDARAQSVLSGGSDLIGKPFLTFEITVKALTLALQGRLRAGVQSAAVHTCTNRFVALRPGLLPAAPGQNPPPQPGTTRSEPALPRFPMVEPGANKSVPANLPALDPTAVLAELSPDQMTQAFLARALSQLGELRDRVQAIFQATDEKAREEMLVAVYLRLNSLLPAANFANGHPALRLSAALEALVKKLLQNPSQPTSSALFTLATAVDLLNDLCVAGVKPDLATNPPIRILVADDEPLSRRAITGALQIAFEKPNSVESGEAAINAANQSPFDLIFLDVQMPGMDGFTACFRIHETVLNRTTPVVFVTGQSDFKARTQATLSGGGDLIAKPFLTAEVTVKALTHVLRGRLRRLRAGATLLAASDEPAADPSPASDRSSDRAAKRRELRRQERRFRRVNRVSHQSA